MWRRLLLSALLLAGCSKGPQADLPYISEARSLTAEWALVNDQAARNKLTANYTETLRDSFREQLQTTAKSLTQPDSAYGQEIRAILAEPADAPPEELRAHAGKLKQIEDSLESA
jgi:hypothetical protein